MSRIQVSSQPTAENAEYQDGPTLFSVVVGYAEEYLEKKGFFTALGENFLPLDHITLDLDGTEDWLSEDYMALEKIGEALGEAILQEAKKQPGFDLGAGPPPGITLNMDLRKDQYGVAWGPGFFEVAGQRYDRHAGANNEDSGTLVVDRSTSGGKIRWEFTGIKSDIDPALAQYGDALIELSSMPGVYDHSTQRSLNLFHVHRVFGSTKLPRGIMGAALAAMVKAEGMEQGYDMNTGEKTEMPFDAIQGTVANQETLDLIRSVAGDDGGDVPQEVLEQTTLGKMRKRYAELLGYEVDRHRWDPVAQELMTFLRKA